MPPVLENVREGQIDIADVSLPVLGGKQVPDMVDGDAPVAGGGVADGLFVALEDGGRQGEIEIGDRAVLRDEGGLLQAAEKVRIHLRYLRVHQLLQKGEAVFPPAETPTRETVKPALLRTLCLVKHGNPPQMVVAPMTNQAAARVHHGPPYPVDADIQPHTVTGHAAS